MKNTENSRNLTNVLKTPLHTNIDLKVGRIIIMIIISYEVLWWIQSLDNKYEKIEQNINENK